MITDIYPLLGKIHNCDCQGMRAARARFQALVRGNPQAQAKPIDYDPDKFLGQQEQIFEEEL